MKFNVLGREADVWWRHLLLYIGIFILLSIAMEIAWLAYSFAAGASTPDQLYMNQILPYFGIILTPLLALVFLSLAVRLGMKKDVAFCRSMACAEFIVFGVLYSIAAFFIYSMNIPPHSGLVYATVYVVNNFFGFWLSAAVDAVVFYLWMLAILEFDKKRIGSAAGLAVAYAFSVFLISEAISFISALSVGGIYSTSIDALTIQALLMNFFFSLPVLYQITGKKLDKAAYVFAALMVLPFLISAIANLLLGEASAVVKALDGLMLVFPELALLYLLSGAKLPNAG